MSFAYTPFSRRWSRRTDEASLPLPISHSADLEAGSSRSTRDHHHGSGSGKRRFRLLDARRAAKGIVRFGLPAGGWYMYWTDIFHTLLNMPRHRFLLVFFAVYLTEYLIFALLYLTQPDSCVGGVMRFSHAMWFSVQTASTLGYTGMLQPNPDCPSVNILVIVQVITAALIDYCMMGLVFARFASPNKRSLTIRFSSTAVLFQRSEDGLWCLSFRLANIRKTALINPQVSLMLALPVDRRGPTSSAGGAPPSAAAPTASAHFRFRELAVEDLSSQAANLRLGLHAHINHVIRPGSPLFDRSLDALEGLGGEVLCFMEGVDPMTSNNIQARHSYTPQDIRMNERFVPIDLKLRGNEVGLDLSGFDATTAKALEAGGADEVREGGFATFLMPVPGPTPGPAPGSALVPPGPGGGDGIDGWPSGGGDGIPLGTLRPHPGRGDSGGGGGADDSVAGGAAAASGGEVDTVMAAALSGDMRAHMRALRSQSIRSLTTPLSALPSFVPSVAATAAATPRGGQHPLAPGGGSGAAGGLAAVAEVAQAGSSTTAAGGAGWRYGNGGGGGVYGSSSGGAGVAGAAELHDLCDAVLTDVGASPAVKRQAAALKEALGALEHVPRGPAQLAGRQL